MCSWTMYLVFEICLKELSLGKRLLLSLKQSNNDGFFFPVS